MNAALLIASSLLLRTVGIFFNAFVSAKVGAAAMGLYSLITSVYFFATTFATSGVNLAATRLVAEALVTGGKARARASVIRCCLYALFFGSIATAGLMLGANFIGGVLLDDVRTIKSIRIFAISLVPIALTSCLSGYFNAVKRTYKNATASVFEQGVRIAGTTLLLLLLADDGMESACIALVLGGAVAEVLSFLFMFIQFLHDRACHLKKEKKGLRDGEEKEITSSMLKITLPVAVSSYIRAGLVTIEHILVPRGLRRSGADRDAALASYGTVHGMSLPIVFFPAAVTGAFASLLIPEMAECLASGNEKRKSYIASRVVRLALIYSICTAGIMISFSSSLGNVIYKSEDAGMYIRMLAPLIPVMYLDSAVDSMLKGLGKQVYSMGVNIADAFVSVILVWLLLPGMGIKGYIISIYACELLNDILSVYKLLTITSFRFNIISTIVKPFLSITAASFLSGVFMRGITQYASHVIEMSSGLSLAVAIILTVLFYIIIMRIIKGIKNEDIEWVKGIFREQGAGRRGQETGSSGQGAGGRAQGAGRRGQETGSSGQGAGSRRQFTVHN
jgi:stage V sporulation protein B